MSSTVCLRWNTQYTTSAVEAAKQTPPQLHCEFGNTHNCQYRITVPKECRQLHACVYQALHTSADAMYFVWYIRAFMQEKYIERHLETLDEDDNIRVDYVNTFLIPLEENT